MKVKKVPMRTCVVTHEKCEKKDLLRIVKNNEGVVFVDDTLKANGRGAYLKKDNNVIENFPRRGVATFWHAHQLVMAPITNKAFIKKNHIFILVFTKMNNLNIRLW